MRAFYEAYAPVVASPAQAVPSSAGKKVAQAVRQTDGPALPDVLAGIPWGHNIVLVLCKTRDRVIAEYALRDIAKPIGVAQWQTKLVHSLPEPLRSNLRTIQQIEEELGDPK